MHFDPPQPACYEKGRQFKELTVDVPLFINWYYISSLVLYIVSQSPMDVAAAREKMIARRFGGAQQSRTGGKGSFRRKKKTVHKTATSDEKKLGSTLKKLGVTNIPAIEEVNLFTSDGKVIHFSNPKGDD